MPVLRGRGRRGKQQLDPQPPINNAGKNRNQGNKRNRQPAEENAGIATRTRRRTAAAAAVVAAPVKEKIVAAVEAAAAPEVKEVKQVPEEVGEKPMDSGGKSPGKVNMPEDDLASPPLPEKVRIFNILS